MKTELQAGKEAKKRQQGLWFTGGLSVWVFFGKWMAILKRTKTDLTSEGNQIFLHSMSQNKSCQNLFRKNNRIELSMRPWAGSDSVQSAGVGLANTYQTTWHPSASSGEIPCWRMMIHLLWKGVAPNSTQCPWLSTPFIHLPTSVWAEPLMEIAMKAHIFKTWFVGVFGKFIPSWQQNTSGCGAKLELKLYAVPFSKLIKSR